MATQLSKADRIRQLLELGHLSDAQMAARVGCHEGYVRAVRYRTSMDGNPISRPADIAWRNANWSRLLKMWRESKRRRRAEARAS